MVIHTNKRVQNNKSLTSAGNKEPKTVENQNTQNVPCKLSIIHICMKAYFEKL